MCLVWISLGVSCLGSIKLLEFIHDCSARCGKFSIIVFSCFFTHFATSCIHDTNVRPLLSSQSSPEDFHFFFPTFFQLFRLDNSIVHWIFVLLLRSCRGFDIFHTVFLVLKFLEFSFGSLYKGIFFSFQHSIFSFSLGMLSLLEHFFSSYFKLWCIISVISLLVSVNHLFLEELWHFWFFVCWVVWTATGHFGYYEMRLWVLSPREMLTFYFSRKTTWFNLGCGFDLPSLGCDSVSVLFSEALQCHLDLYHECCLSGSWLWSQGLGCDRNRSMHL